MVSDNLLFGNADGVLVDHRSVGTVVRGNIAWGSTDDGIDADHAATTITSNFAFENADWGIEAIAAVTDGGGNRAWGNGQPEQCLNVACEPPEACRIRATGRLTAANGDSVRLRASLGFDGESQSTGTLLFIDDGPVEPLVIRSTPSAVICDGDRGAQAVGEVELDGSTVPYVADLIDRGSRKRDRFRLRLASGYDSGSQALESGNIIVR